jgi:hypothetical protein
MTQDPYSTDVVTQIVVDPNDPQVRKLAVWVAQVLVEDYGPGAGTAIAVVTVKLLLSGLLACAGPAEDFSRDNITRLLERLKENTLGPEPPTPKGSVQ